MHSHPSRRPTAALALAALTALAVLTGCGGRGDESDVTAPQRIESPALELALASLPEPFVLAENSGSTLRLSTTHDTGGEVVVEVGEPEYGLNLQAEVVRRGDAFRALPGGEYNGSRELGTPYGPAFYSRGSYDAAAGREEQTWIFALHPGGDSRLLTLIYTYPAGQGQARVNELLALVGEFEALTPMAPSTP